MRPIGRGATLGDVVPSDLPELVDAVERHRLRMADLLEGLDVARRAVSGTGTGRPGGSVDLTTLVAHFSDDLRASDQRLQALVTDLCRRLPESCGTQEGRRQPWS
jgi:hypothetical protein